MEEKEAEREKREYERQVERERREYESESTGGRRLVREEERLRKLRNEKEEVAVREAGRQQSCVRKP